LLLPALPLPALPLPAAEALPAAPAVPAGLVESSPQALATSATANKPQVRFSEEDEDETGAKAFMKQLRAFRTG
jgi:hypothetical protein